MTEGQSTDFLLSLRGSRFIWVLGLAAGLTAVVGGVVLAFGGPFAALALVLAILAALVTLRDPEVGFWAVIGVVCLLPFATIPVDIGLTPTLLDLALGATIGVWALRVVSGRQRSIVTAPITVPLLIFILIALFAFVFGMGNGPLTANLVRHFAEMILSIGFVLVIVDFCSSWRRIERLVTAIVLAGTGAAAIGILLWLLPDFTANDVLGTLQRVGYPGGFVIRYIEDNPELSERAISTSVDPNALGGLLLMIGALASPQLFSRRPIFPRRFTLLLLGLVSSCLILTFSRGALLGLVAGLAFLAFVRYRRLIPYLVAAALLFLLLPVTQGYIARFLEGFQILDLATQMRIGEYRDAVSLIFRYPLFGVGFAGSPDIDLYLGVANVYLTIAQQMGILGLAGFLVLIATVFIFGLTNRIQFRDEERVDSIWLGLHAALVGGLVAGLFDHYLFNIDFHHAVTFFWLILGLAVATTRVGSEGAA